VSDGNLAIISPHIIQIAFSTPLAKRAQQGFTEYGAWAKSMLQMIAANPYPDSGHSWRSQNHSMHLPALNVSTGEVKTLKPWRNQLPLGSGIELSSSVDSESSRVSTTASYQDSPITIDGRPYLTGQLEFTQNIMLAPVQTEDGRRVILGWGDLLGPSGVSVINLGVGSFLTQFSVTYVGQQSEQLLFLISESTENEQSTSLVRAVRSSSGIAVLSNKKISEHFFHAHELRNGLEVPNKQEIQSALFSPERILAARNNSRSEEATEPFIELATVPEKFEYRFLNPTSEISLSNNLIYKYFDDGRLPHRYSGVYIAQQGAKIAPPQIGELLLKNGSVSPDTTRSELDISLSSTATYLVPDIRKKRDQRNRIENPTGLSSSIFAIDPGWDSGDNGFNLVALLSISNNASVPQRFQPFRVDASFTKLLNVSQVLIPKSDSTATLYIIYSVDTSEAGSEGASGRTLCKIIDIEYSHGAINSNGSRDVIISKEQAYLGTDLNDRLHLDRSGSLLIQTDGAEKREGRKDIVSFMNLSVGTRLEVRTREFSTSGLQLLSTQTAEGAEGSVGSLISTSNNMMQESWKVYGLMQFAKRLAAMGIDVDSTFKNVKGSNQGNESKDGNAKKNRTQVKFDQLRETARRKVANGKILIKLGNDGRSKFFSDFFEHIVRLNSQRGEHEYRDKWLRASDLGIYFSGKDLDPQDIRLNQGRILTDSSEPTALFVDLRGLLDWVEGRIEQQSEDFAADPVNSSDLDSMASSYSDSAAGVQMGEDGPSGDETADLRVKLIEGALNQLVGSDSKLTNHANTILVGTFEDIEYINSALGKTGNSLDSFGLEVNSSFANNVFSAGDPQSGEVPSAVKDAMEHPSTITEEKIIDSVFEELRSAATPNAETAVNTVFLIPDELLSYVNRIVTSVWADTRPARASELWSCQNSRLKLFLASSGLVSVLEASKQPANTLAFDHLKQMDPAQGTASVFVGDLDTIRKMGRHISQSAKGPLHISDPLDPERLATPHFLYLLANDGSVPGEIPQDRTGKRSKNRGKSIILLGTESQWEKLQGDLTLENNLGLAKMFTIKRIERPTVEARVSRIEDILNEFKLGELGYRFDISTRSTSQKNIIVNSTSSSKEFAEYLVNRADNISTENKTEVTSNYVRMETNLRDLIKNDSEIRRTKVLDRTFAERVLAKAFGLALHYEILPEDDPIRILQRDDGTFAAMELQRRGYNGPIELKLKFIKALANQSQNTSVLPIPSSQIIYGRGGTGKTLLWTTTVLGVLNRKLYDFANGAENEDASAMMIDVSKVATVSNSRDVYSEDLVDDNFEDIEEHLLRFLSGPNGYRGYVLLDDLHKAPSDVLKRFITLINSLFSAPNGIFTRRLRNGEVVSFPIRNLSLTITLNPPSDISKIKKFGGSGTKVDVGSILASLNTDENSVETSFVTRFGTIIPLDVFPVEAKGPQLQKAVSELSKQYFDSAGRLTLLGPQVAQRIADSFKETNVREFVPEASRSIMQLSRRGSNQSNLVSIVIPKSRLRKASTSSGYEFGGLNSTSTKNDPFEVEGRDSTRIATIIEDNFTSVPIDHGFDGRLYLTEMLVDSFRTTLYQTLIEGIQESQAFLNIQNRGEDAGGILVYAINTNLKARPFLPLSLLQLFPEHYGIRNVVDANTFRQGIQLISRAEENYFPVNFGVQSSLAELLGSESLRNYRRSDVLSTFSTVLLDPVRQFLEKISYFKTQDGNLTPSQWIDLLPESGKPESAKQTKRAMLVIAHQILDAFFKFAHEINDRNVHESRSRGNTRSPDLYDISRLFMIVIDKSISALPWSSLQRTVSETLIESTKSLQLAQDRRFQNYFFQTENTLVRPGDPMTLEYVSASYPPYKNLEKNDGLREKNSNFESSCRLFFSENMGEK